jgi:hypothetical protein
MYRAVDELRALLAPDIVWHVPGSARRRDLADRTFRMHPGELLVGDDDHVAACWLLPLDAAEFDRIWRG